MDNLNAKAAKIFDGLNRNDSLKFTENMFQSPSMTYTDPESGESREMSQEELNEYIAKSPVIYSSFMNASSLSQQNRALLAAQENVSEATSEAIALDAAGNKIDMYEYEGEGAELPKAARKSTIHQSESLQLTKSGLVEHSQHKVVESGLMSKSYYTVEQFQQWLAGQNAMAEAPAEAIEA